MTLQEQLDNFPSGYAFIILEVVGDQGHVMEVLVLHLDTWDRLLKEGKLKNPPVPMPSRYVHHSKNWLGQYHNPQGFPSNGDGLYSLARVYRLYDVASYMGESLEDLGAE